MSGKTTFLTGSALICIPSGICTLYTLIVGLPWFFPTVGNGIIVSLAYGAWRGERWAYYMLIFFCVLALVLYGVLFHAACSPDIVLIGAIEILGKTLGVGLIAFHPSSREFMRCGEVSIVTRKKQGVLAVAGSLIIPCMLMSVYSTLAHYLELSAKSDFYGFSVSIIGGLVCFYWIPIRGFWKFLISLLYVPALVILLLGYQFAFEVLVLKLRF